jgi:hypothetical protein
LSTADKRTYLINQLQLGNCAAYAEDAWVAEVIIAQHCALHIVGSTFWQMPIAVGVSSSVGGSVVHQLSSAIAQLRLSNNYAHIAARYQNATVACLQKQTGDLTGVHFNILVVENPPFVSLDTAKVVTT